MKKGKRLLTVLLVFLFAMGMFTVASLAASGDVTESHQGNTYTFTYQDGSDYFDATYVYGAPDITYNKAAYNSSGFTKTSTGSSTPDFNFLLVSSSYEGTTAGGSSYGPTVSAPDQAGEYTVTQTYRVRFRSGELIIGNPATVTVSDDFEIMPRSVALNWTNTDVTYYATNYPNVSLGSGKMDGDALTVSCTQEKNAGVYTGEKASKATLGGADADNYVISKGMETQDFTINKRPISVKWTNTSFIYDGQPHVPTCEMDAQPGERVGDDVVDVASVTGAQTEKGSYSGDKAAKATLNNDNYTIKEDATPGSTATMPFTIGAQKVYVVWGNDVLTYNGEVQHPTATLKVVGGGDADEDAEVVVYKVFNGLESDGNIKENKKTDEGTTYWAVASLKEGSNYEFVTTGDDPSDPNRVKEFNNIQPYPIDVDWVADPSENQKKITYDAKKHTPTADVEDEIFEVDSGKVGANVYIDGDTVQGEKYEDEDGVVYTVSSDGVEPVTTGVKDASSSNYTAKVEKPILGGKDKGLVGPEAHNYVLKKNKYTYDFQIVQKKVSLEWFRPAYNEYGEEITGSDGVVYVMVKEGDLNLVFNGQPQAPTAKIAKNSIIEGDECDILVEKNENAVRKGTYTTGKLTLSNKNYSAEDEAVQYKIVPRPVRLRWDAYDATYNGKAQEREAIIDNIATTEDGSQYSDKTFGVVKVSKYTYTDGKHFEGDEQDYEASWYADTDSYNKACSDGLIPEKPLGDSIAEDRTPIDAGVYTMTATKLSDEFNYTLFKLTPDEVENGEVVEDGGAVPSENRVDLYAPYYTIHQYEITKIDWRNTTVTYNASYQKPIAEVNKSDLQGPDTNKQVAVMITDNLDRTHEEDFLGFCNAKNAYDVYVFKNEGSTPHRGIKGERSMNYIIGKDAQKMQTKFVINKKDLTVTVYDKVGYYGDNPDTYKHTVKYTGLVNGNPNDDDNHNKTNVPGKYNPNAPMSGDKKDVVDTSGLKFTTNYKKNGKPGTYAISASGLTSDNYAIKYVDGKLTINDKVTELVAQGKSKGKKAAIVTWNTVSDAASYDLYWSKCSTKKKKYTPKYIGTVAGNAYKVKKLEKGVAYKFYVVAKDASNNPIAVSPMSHFIIGNVMGKYTNPKTITPSTNSVTVSAGGAAQVTTKLTMVKKDKKPLNGKHTQKLRYFSANPEVAVVAPNGVIAGVAPGWCRVYAIATNGMWSVIEVNVN